MSPILVQNEAGLRNLIDTAGARFALPGRPLAIRLPNLSLADNRRWQQLLEAERNACGCQSAALALAGYLMLSVIVLIMAAGPGFSPNGGVWIGIVILFVLGMVASALAGKAAGRRMARARYQRVLSQFATSSAQTGD